MLIQMPRGSSDQPGAQNAEECSAFEAALRRDLATAPVVSYESVLGGWAKRTFDLALTLAASPVWVPLLLAAALWSKLRHGGAVFRTHERVGYGGHSFKCLTLRIAPPPAVVEALRRPNGEAEPANDWQAIAGQAENPREKWRRALERLPQLVSVLRGEMALVGPTPLTREDLEPLKSAKRYYLSARPGVVGVGAVTNSDEEGATEYKTYTRAWSLSTDILLLWDALRSLRDRGELWRPSLKLPKVGARDERIVARRSRSVGAEAPQDTL
jgi:lipopolysaccharide/colanic/teichoic acid biosynthesis glycosyltransferase